MANRIRLKVESIKSKVRNFVYDLRENGIGALTRTVKQSATALVATVKSIASNYSLSRLNEQVWNVLQRLNNRL